MRASLMAMVFLASLLLGAPALAQLTPGDIPDGWSSVEPAEGTIAALRHGDTLGRLEVVKLAISNEDFGQAQQDLTGRLTSEGFSPVGRPEPVKLGAVEAQQRRFTTTMLEREFSLLLVEALHDGQLWQLTVVFSPTQDTNAETIERDAHAYFSSLIN